MRWFFLLPLSLWTLVSCQSNLTHGEFDAAEASQRGAQDVDVGDWRIEGDYLDVERDITNRLVMLVTSQGNASVQSLKVPRSSRVMTTAQADEIYYDVFSKRFELVGNPVVRQGLVETRPLEVPNRIWLLADGSVKTSSPDFLRDSSDFSN